MIFVFAFIAMILDAPLAASHLYSNLQVIWISNAGLLPRAPRNVAASVSTGKNFYVPRLKAVNEAARVI